jgi:hypothetical protein
MSVTAQLAVEPNDSVQTSVSYLKHFLLQQNNWKTQNPEVEKSLRGLIHFVEDEGIDTVLVRVNKYLSGPSHAFFMRAPEQVADSLHVPGYIPKEQLDELLRQTDRSVRSKVDKAKIMVPRELTTGIDSLLPLIQPNDAEWLVHSGVVTLPDSLKTFSVISDTAVLTANDVRRIQRLENTRRKLLEAERVKYNAKIRRQYVDSVSAAYREEYVNLQSIAAQSEQRQNIKRQNKDRLIQYNDSVTAIVNDSISRVLHLLSAYAAKDSIPLWLYNTRRDSVRIALQNNDDYSTRLYVRNPQNDSITIRIRSLGKHSMQFEIDDPGVTKIERTSAKTVITAGPIKEAPKPTTLATVEQKIEILSPWTLSGKFNFSLNQTSLHDWKAGGKNSLSISTTFDGNANYAKGKTTWTNLLQFRNGWVRPADERIQKNMDLLLIQSRYGLKAFKSWYWSGQADFNTQLFKGYRNPSAATRADRGMTAKILSPAYLTLSAGLDYKPKSNFSLYIAPLSGKMTFVLSDSLKPNYGLRKDQKTTWDTGLNANLTWTKPITITNEDGKKSTPITYTTRWTFFDKYKDINKFSFRMDNTFNVVLSTFVNMVVYYNLLYDANVLFDKIDADGNPVMVPSKNPDGSNKLDDSGNQVMEKATEKRWQRQEIIGISFVYNFSKVPKFVKQKR